MRTHDATDLDGTAGASGAEAISLVDELRSVETRLIQRALDTANGNKTKAAALLGLKRTTLNDRMKYCGLVPGRADAVSVDLLAQREQEVWARHVVSVSPTCE